MRSVAGCWAANLSNRVCVHHSQPICHIFLCVLICLPVLSAICFLQGCLLPLLPCLPAYYLLSSIVCLCLYLLCFPLWLLPCWLSLPLYFIQFYHLINLPFKYLLSSCLSTCLLACLPALLLAVMVSNCLPLSLPTCLCTTFLLYRTFILSLPARHIPWVCLPPSLSARLLSPQSATSFTSPASVCMLNFKYTINCRP